MEYDGSVSEAEKNILLLNIARVADAQPPHFTVTNTVNAQFSFSSTASFMHELFSIGSKNDTSTFSLGASVTEQPTLTLGPVQGEEFVRRSFKPFDSSSYNLFLAQDGAYLTPLLQLTTAEYFLFPECFFPKPPKGCLPTVGKNKPSSDLPSDRESAWRFREFIAYLEELRMNEELEFDFLDYNEPVGGGIAKEAVDQQQIIAAADKGYEWIPSYFSQENTDIEYILVKPRRANIILKNIRGPIREDQKATLRRLRESEPHPDSVILFVLRNCDATVDKGLFRLRNFYETLRFVAAGVGSHPLEMIDREAFIKPKNPELTPLYPEYPLVIGRGSVPPKNAARIIKYNDEYYWVPEGPATKTAFRPKDADKKMFTLLYHLSQMVITDPKVMSPVLTLGGK